MKTARFDAAIDYKSEEPSTRGCATCPRGIDVYFDNVGGATLDHALASLAMYGRVVLCGAIATYNDETRGGPKNYLNLVLKRGAHGGLHHPRLHPPRGRRRPPRWPIGTAPASSRIAWT